MTVTGPRDFVPQSTVSGLDHIVVRIEGVVDNQVETVDRSGTKREIDCSFLRAKAAKPRVGELWVIDRKIGGVWSFAGVSRTNPPIITGNVYGNTALADLLGEMEADGLLMNETTDTGLPEGAGGGAVDSVNGQIGDVVLDAEDVGALTETEGDTRYQPLDSQLSALAGLSPVADRLMYWTGVNAVALSAITAFARTLIDDVDATTARGTLGLGTAATAALVDLCLTTDPRLSDARTPIAHHISHEPGGTDPMAVDAAAGTGSLRTLGTNATQAAAGNDARLSDARTPTAHATTHQPGGTDALAVDAAAATGSLRTLGTGATQAAAGNDARLSDQRTPTDNSVTSAKIVDGTIVGGDIAKPLNLAPTLGFTNNPTAVPVLDLRKTSSQLHVTNTDTADGAYLLGIANGGYMSAGCHFDGSVWKADQNTAISSVVAAAGGLLLFYQAPQATNVGDTVNLSEKLRVDINGHLWNRAGTGTGMGKVGGTLFNSFADVGCASSGETDLVSNSVVGSTLSVNGEGLKATYTGITVAHATATRQIRLYFGGTLIFDSAAQTSTSAGTWRVDADIIRVSASVVRCSVVWTSKNISGTAVTPTYTEITGLTLTNAQVFKITGTTAAVGAAANDIVLKQHNVDWKQEA